MDIEATTIARSTASEDEHRGIVILTVFRKTRQREEAEIERARQAQKVCEAEHGPAEHTYDRTKEDKP